MVFCYVLFFKRRPDITFEAFKHLFETEYVPFMKDLVGPRFPLSYTRKYVSHVKNDKIWKGMPAVMVGRQDEVWWDCLAELVFQDELHFLQFWNFLNEDESARKLFELEAKFSQMDALQFMMMESWESGNEYRTAGSG